MSIYNTCEHILLLVLHSYALNVLYSTHTRKDTQNDSQLTSTAMDSFKGHKNRWCLAFGFRFIFEIIFIK